MLQIKKLRIRNLLTYEDSGWIELGRRTLIVGPNGSGKTNMIRALRLLRAAVGLEGSIQKAELRSYLHDLGESSAGIDLEISLSEGEAADACQLFCSYLKENREWISPGPSCKGLKERLTGDVRISFSWISADGESPLGSSDVKALYAIWFSKANFGVLLRAGSPQMTANYVKVCSEYIYCSRPKVNPRGNPRELEVNPKELYELYKKCDEVKNSSGQKPIETRRKIYEKICGESGGEEKGVCGDPELECAALPPVPIERSPFREIVERYGLLQLLSPVSISPSHETAGRILFTSMEEFSYPAGYILLLIVLSNIVFAGSERMLSDASKLAALRRLIEKEPNHDLAAIIDSTLGWAREDQLDAYLRNVEPFLAHLSLSGDREKKQRFRKISGCFSKYFPDMKILKPPKVRLRHHPAPPQPEAQSTPVTRALSEVLARLQDATASLQYSIYLRENTGKGEAVIPIDAAGQGHRELLSLLTALIARPGSVVFLDEPASNMHPTLLSRFLMDLLGRGECSRELGHNQVIVITHSPAVAKLFVEADVRASNLSIIRVHRRHDGASVIGYLTPNKWPGGEKEFLKTIGRIVDPRVLFAKGVVLIEGPDDRAFLEMALRLSGGWEELLRNDIEIVYMNTKHNLKRYKGLLEELKIPYLAVLDGDARGDLLRNEPDDSKCVLKPPSKRPSEGEGCVDAVIREGCRYILLEPKELECFLGCLGLDVVKWKDSEDLYELIEEEVKNNPDFNRKFECAGKILSQLIDSALNGSSTRMLSGRLSGLACMGTRSPAASYRRGIA
ncbi:MAG: AAA family ATPase [Nitrososphaeria archaeon]